MRTKKGFYLHKIFDENVIMADGVENIDFNNIIALNKIAAYLWEHIEGHDFSIDDMVEAVLQEYEVDAETARQDCTSLVKKWIDAGIVEE